MNERTTILVALLTGTILFLTLRLIQWWISCRYKRHSVVNGLKQMALVYTELEALFAMPGVDRVLLLRGHNSGGIPRPGMPFYTSVVYRADDDNDTRYEDVSVDASYVRTLVSTYTSGDVSLKTDLMENCNLKEWYSLEKVTHAVIAYLAIVNVSFIYVSIASRRDKGFTSSELIEIRKKIDRIRKLINKT